MSSRQEEKERRRREREERDAAAAQRAASRRRLQLVAGAVLGLALIGAIVAVALSSSGDTSKTSNAGDGGVAIPARKITDFQQAVKASGCVYRHYPQEGRTHLSSDTAVFNHYRTNPPTSGNHRPIAAEDGIYTADNPPAKENSVHSLEHGRVEIQYAPDAPRRLQQQLITLFNEEVKGTAGYHQLLFPNQTNMPYEVAATAWTQSLTCKKANPRIFDAIRAFRERFIDKGPELVP